MDEKKKDTRRRGGILEEAILKAAWEELSTTGYTDMTMESIATRAGTNKAVLYRRWHNKTELVISAIHKNIPKITDEIPNTGNLRNDMYTYLHERVEPMNLIGGQTIRGLFMEPFVWRTIITSMPQINERRLVNKITTAITGILKNAELRGEISLKKLTPRIISLPLDLLQYELITKLEPVSDEAITQIIDDIFLPIVYIHAGVIN
ncbi:TetR/AcrR family transcriptional regulator [Anaerocolumna sp. MB42-C2]|uniref:TetR/AcrR family transcriptional regulator n=1 Tax=Anaerocolumna sp. MB42-C2 TaxID=3070997 RepID=UPI0027DF6CE4|nr:TetR/AcrR family transcriptional regulator [Anaerocolumna sp. MB42-C2]WMJ89133.1 TetR/AcrR family transcriptional regulator [Anaerocolumna sp. MB42-C2]